MRIICVSDAWHPQVNGVVRTYQNIERALTAQGHAFHVIGPDRFPVTLPLPTYPDIRIALFAGLTLPDLLDRAAFDAIHIATEGPLGRAARDYCLKRGQPFTTAYHTRFPEYLAQRAAAFPALAKTLLKHARSSLKDFHAAAHGTMVVSQSLEDHLRNEGYSGRLHRLERGVDTTVFHPGPPSLFSNLPRPVALYVGRIAVEKNIEAFLDAQWHGSKVVVGAGPDLKRLRAKYQGVHFAGLQEGSALADHYRSADVFAFPSLTDTFGVVQLEALACGLPVAAFPVLGPQGLIDRPEFGSLSDDFTYALHTAAASPGARAERGRTVSERYSWDNVARQFVAGLAQR